MAQDEQEREKKKSALVEKRQQVEAKWQTIQQWEDDLMTVAVKTQMKHLPEVRIALAVCCTVLSDACYTFNMYLTQRRLPQ